VTDNTHAPDPAPPLGIGGWLILPPIHLAIDIGLFAWLFVAAAMQQEGTEGGVAGATPQLSEAIMASLIFLAFDLAIALFAAFCLVRLFQRKRQVPNLMTAFYLLVIAKAAINLALLYGYPLLATGADDMFNAWKGVVQSAVAGAIWISYFRVSVRVANTFTR